MRRLFDGLVRLPWGEVTQRALEETAADTVHEMASAPTRVSRAGRLGVGLAGVARVAFLAFTSFGEGEHPMRNIARDVRFGWRRLRATPAFTLFAVFTLALGIGATTAIFSIVHRVMGPPPGVTTIDRLVNVTHTEAGSIPMIALSYGDYLDLRARQTVFAHVAGWMFFQQAFSAKGQAETAFGEAVGGDYFETLGVNVQLGRAIQPADDVPGAPAVAVISDGVWRRLFGGSTDIIGQSVKLNGVRFEIVGVAPQSFAGLFNGGFVPSAMWIPLNAQRLLLPAKAVSSLFDLDNRSNRWIQVRGLLNSSVTVDEAKAQVTGIGKALDQTYPIGRGLSPELRAPFEIGRPWVVRRTLEVPVNETAARIIRPMAAVVMIAVGLVLLVACTNLANLMLARHSSRQHELAVRLALGASRWRLVRAALVENLLVAAAGGLAGIGVARAALVFLGRDLPAANGVALHLAPRLDPAVLVLAAAATLLALLVFGLVPALQSTRSDVRSALTTDGDHAGVPRWRGRRFLIAMQVMVSVMLLSTAALYVAQLRVMSDLNGGIDLPHLAVAQVDFTHQQIAPARAHEIVDAVLEEMRRRPDVLAAAASSGLPFGLTTPGGSVGVSRPSQVVAMVASTPGIFDALGVSIVHGRSFDARDTASSEPVIVVSERTAKSLFERSDVVGRQVAFQRQRWEGEPEPLLKTLTVIGVAADTDSGAIGNQTRGVAYLPVTQQDEGRLVFTARSRGNPEPLVGALRQATAAVDSSLAVAQSGTGGAVAGPSSLVFVEIVSAFSGLLGLLALALALAGLYGVLAHVVTRRTREVGVRIALGASRRDILVLVLRDGLVPVASGLVAGLGLGLILRVMLRPLFVQLLPAMDPIMMTSIPLAMLTAAVLACYLPARRAAKLDPNVALREL